MMSDGLLSRYSKRVKAVNRGETTRSADGDRTRSTHARPQRLGLLVLLHQGEKSDRAFELREGRMTIGRSPESDIVLEESAVSWMHAIVTRDEAGNYRIRDQGSANGVYVNSLRISEHVLEDGDEIQVGLTVLAFRQ